MTNYQLAILIEAITNCFEALMKVAVVVGPIQYRETLLEHHNDLGTDNCDLMWELNNSTPTGQQIRKPDKPSKKKIKY